MRKLFYNQSGYFQLLKISLVVNECGNVEVFICLTRAFLLDCRHDYGIMENEQKNANDE